MSIAIKIKRLHPEAKLPSYAHVGDAGMDLFSAEDYIIKPQDRQKIGTGISIEIPEGYVGLVWDKSSVAATHGLKHLGGVMDAGYRGEYIVTLINLSDKEYRIHKGDKVAQLLIQKVEHPDIEEVSELSDSSRGTGAFGSTGKK
jgi:dUTP pyrophosphatase